MVAIVKGITGDWEIIIGLEMHAQVISNAKLFSGASTDFGAEPNTQVSFVDAGFPGMLPVLNEKCIEQAVKTGLGINAKINLRSVFDRKNYFYPDLPTGYQISQFYHPIVEHGKVYLDMPNGVVKEVGVTRIHLEQDAGKSLHDQSPNETFIDLNRAGVALMEIVSEPDLRSSEEAGEYVRKLRSIVRYLGTCDGDMEKGSLRCDANVSVRRVGENKLNTRVEIKNINSIRNIMRAIDHEAARQVSVMEGGGSIVQETRLFDANTGETRTMRSKEEAHDYRYFADPDLMPLVLTDEYVDAIRKSLPELPDQKIRRYTKEMGLSHYDASVLVSEKLVAEYFEEVAKKSDAKVAANWITGELFGRLNKEGLSIEENPISAAQLSELLELIGNGTISGKIAKGVFDTMFVSGGSAKEIVESQGLTQVSDNSAIQKIVDDVIAQNPDKVAEYRSGKDKLFGFFVGQVMKLSQGKANPSLVNDVLKAKLQ
ncbi:MAG: Asp-tRNA(Asn)/Glu-tRNA(Gln) amidotransferase subunit GatB [Candidatus Jidaibacter sp.]|nr:Asp-tRNA(Asn)/Glu-tRNA(Gln) amidotransferase subunit GatB [Candidatus Jidaibacter sp.]